MNAGSVHPLLARAVLGLVALAGGGCATPGPTHLYTFSRGQPETIRDSGPVSALSVPSYTDAADDLTGLAYDPYTDHLFLRLNPGHRIRVVDRPDRSIKRKFMVPELSGLGGGDLAVRPRDGRIFFAGAEQSFIVETDRFGKFVRRLELDGVRTGVSALAYDAGRNRLLVVPEGTPTTLQFHDLTGRLLHRADLGPTRVKSLAYDTRSGEIHAVVGGETGVIIFDEAGRRLRRLLPEEPVDFVDLGERSFIRVF